MKGMQTTLDFWRSKYDDRDGKVPAPNQVPTGRKPTQHVKERSVNITRRKGNNIKNSQIQGQSKILSFLEPKINSMTPSSNFPNSSIQTNNYTTDAGSCITFVGNKTTEARNGTEQLTGERNLTNIFERSDTIGQN